MVWLIIFVIAWSCIWPRSRPVDDDAPADLVRLDRYLPMMSGGWRAWVLWEILEGAKELRGVGLCGRISRAYSCLAQPVTDRM